jgi:hypothetical protein
MAEVAVFVGLDIASNEEQLLVLLLFLNPP